MSEDDVVTLRRAVELQVTIAHTKQQLQSLNAARADAAGILAASAAAAQQRSRVTVATGVDSWHRMTAEQAHHTALASEAVATAEIQQLEAALASFAAELSRLPARVRLSMDIGSAAVAMTRGNT
jgi:hypothetical protein